MATLMVLKPKIRPFLIIIAFLIILAIIIDIYFITSYSELAYSISLGGLAIVVLLILAAVAMIYKKAAHTYEINETDIVERRGVFAHDLNVIPYNKVTDIKVDKTIIGTLLGMGNIHINTAGTGYLELTMVDVDLRYMDDAINIIRDMMEKEAHIVKKGRHSYHP